MKEIQDTTSAERTSFRLAERMGKLALGQRSKRPTPIAPMTPESTRRLSFTPADSMNEQRVEHSRLISPQGGDELMRKI